MDKKNIPSYFGGYRSDSEFFKMDYLEFNEYVGGRLAIALFKGEFNDELFTIIRMAEARGQKYQWEESNKPKEK